MDARLTIKEIAKLSGVGISTVSRVLNKRPDVNGETRERVMAVINEFGYEPNTNAKNLKQLTSDAVAVIVRGANNLFFSGIIEQLQRYIEHTGLQFLPFYIEETDDEVVAAQRVWAERKVRGIIFLGGCHDVCDEQLAALPVPCVYSTVNASGSKAENVSSVCVDDRLGAKQAVDHLFSMGHEDILILGGTPDDWNMARLRYEGVIDSFVEHGKPTESICFAETKFSFKAAYDAVKNYDGKPFTAVFAMSDTVAIGAMRALFDMGRRVPDDVSVIGYDGIELGSYVEPVLTTMRQPQEQIAKASVELLLRGMTKKGKHMLLSTTLITGNSVKTRK